MLVHIHGGWRRGAGSGPDHDGAYAASRGDMAVVTLDYCLDSLGWDLHEDLTEPVSGGCATGASRTGGRCCAD